MRITQKIQTLALFFLVMVVGGYLGINNGMARAGTSDVIKWRWQAHFPSSSSSYKAALVPFVEKIKQRTNGKLVLDLYQTGSLVPNKEIFSAVRRGMIEMGTACPSYFGSKVPLAELTSGLPMAFDNIEQAAYWFKHLGVEQMLRDEFGKYGVYYSSEKLYLATIASRKPIRKLEDFNGLKIRTFGILEKYLADLGAHTTYVPSGEMYTALSTGVVDAANWGSAPGAYSMGFFDSCKYHLKTNLFVAPTNAWFVNQKELNKLPKEMQDILKCEMEKAFWKGSNWVNFEEIRILRKIVNNHGVKITTIEPDGVKKMRKVAMKYWDIEAQKDPQCKKAIQILKDFRESIVDF